MSKREDERKPGELTSDDLREALRVNKALLSRAAADADVADVSRRSNVIEERIAVLECERAELWSRHANAPVRVAALKKRIEEQEAQLVELSKPQRKSEPGATPAARLRQMAIEKLLARLGAGDTTAIPELMRLANDEKGKK